LLSMLVLSLDMVRYATAAAKFLDTKQELNQKQKSFCQDEASDLAVPGATWMELPVLPGQEQGSRILVYKYGDIVSDHMRNGVWEGAELMSIMRGLAMPMDKSHPAYTPPVFVDVGANIGAFSLAVSKAGYQVYAFEGMPQNIRMLRGTLCANPEPAARVTLFDTGLSDEERECRIYSASYNLGDGVVDCLQAQPSQAWYLTNNLVERGKMHLRRLDALLDEDVRVMKIDVEGFEPYVLRGAEGLFGRRRVSFIVMEFNKPALVGANEGVRGVQAWLDHIVQLGYRVSLKSFTGPFLLSAEVLELEHKEGIFNLFLAHKDTLGMMRSRSARQSRTHRAGSRRRGNRRGLRQGRRGAQQL